MAHSETGHLPLFVEKMKSAGLQPVVIETFSHYYQTLLSGEDGLIAENKIVAAQADEFANAENLTGFEATGRRALDKAVMIVLNGGLGTSMGLTRAKSLIHVREGKTFLDIILKQAAENGVQLALMNSFSTHDDTVSALSTIQPDPFPWLFLQHRFPKILQQTLEPASWPRNPGLEWNPPGHGDVYIALITSGILDKLLASGISYAFICNSDNLGASLDPGLLGYFSEKNFPFMMEVTRRTASDKKGGHLARMRSGRLILREAAQCPQEDRRVFEDIDTHCFFNTNNLWIHLGQLKELVTRGQTIHLPIIVNPKNLDPRDETSPQVYQIETAMGSAISLFEGAAAVRVPRSRFFPVKTCSELLAVQSDCFEFCANGRLAINPKRTLDMITIHLDPRVYRKIDEYEKRFSQGVPSLINCRSLTIEGDVAFEKDVVLKGEVALRNRTKSQVVISSGSIIEGESVFT